ncbi:heparinase II/III family protein [Halomonas sp. LC1]|uniref:heparinase II/III domain-containing protein n=1 Tax=Halomonas sp. LC1 TaxID=3043733 RepID=UPI0025521439|nr:heparinase II/III family protein [Halomonas sp. LC1]MDK9687561.1 heparinase II/III family protein [Halomonas sp. LC1]
MTNTNLIPVHCFLHRIFPVEYYNNAEEIVDKKIFKPRKDSLEFYIDFPLDWEASVRNVDRNWRMQLQGWTFFHPIMNFFDSFDEKNKVVNYFLDVARDWWDKYGSDPDDIVTTRMPKSYAWYDMSVGFRALVITFFADRLDYYKIKLNSEDSFLLQELAAKHIRHLSNPKVFSMNNHGLFQSHGLVGLLKKFPDVVDNPKDKLAYGLKLVESLVVNQFGEEGVHLEHSPHYHFYALNTLKAKIDSGWYDESAYIKEIASKADANSKWLVDPLKRPICVGDSILTVQKNITFPSEDSGDYLCSDIAKSGYSIVRSPWGVEGKNSSMLFMTGAYHHKSHKHRDCLSFDWFESGHRLICDSGKYGYKSDIYRNFFLSNRAHNSVEIEDFDILKVKPYGSSINNPVEVYPGIFKLDGKLDFPAIKHYRTIYYKPGSWLIVMDDLDFVRERTYKQWFHLERDFRLESFTGNSGVFKNDDNISLYVDCLNKDLKLNLHKGDEENMQGFICEKDYQFSPAYALAFEGYGQKNNIVTSLSVSRSAQENAKTFIFEQSLLIDNRKEEVFFKNNILKGVENLSFSSSRQLAKADISYEGEKTTQVKARGVLLSFYSSFKKNASKLAVFLPGATSRKYGEFDFQRHSWGQDLADFDCVFFSDPSVKDSNNLTLGWFQNEESSYGIDSLKEVIVALLKKTGYTQKELFIFGSSGGGYVALKLSEYFKNALVLAINPQIYLFNYSISHYENMLRCCYEGRAASFVKKNFYERLVYTPSSFKRKNPVFILQNISDDKHYKKHFMPLANKRKLMPLEIDSVGNEEVRTNLNLLTYKDDVLKHTPPNKEDTLAVFEKIFRFANFK